MKTQRIQAAFARRREAEHLRIEKTSEINRYFDHWNKVTSRFESWTTPEYYKNAEETFKKQQESKLKEKMLEERRNKLRLLFEEENANYREELRLSRRPTSKKISTDILKKIDDNLKYREEERRRLDLESKLYGRWRHGTATNERDLFKSKSDNETMAKLNWLDKQIEKNMEKEKEQKESEERKLRMQKEARKREEHLKERQKIQESEIKELRTIQENHLRELKLREAECEGLHDEEIEYKRKLEQLTNELDRFKLRKKEHSSLGVWSVYNIKKLKMIIRQRSEHIRQDLKDDIELLRRISEFIQNDQITSLIQSFKYQYHIEIENQSQIEAMYESEVKYNLKKWEETWKQQAECREDQILKLLEKQQAILECKLSENLNKQKLLVEVREAHLAAIENSNDKLKMLSKEEREDEMVHLAKSNSTDICKNSVMDHVTKKVSNCNIEADTPVLPKFGRKRVAWT